MNSIVFLVQINECKTRLVTIKQVQGRHYIVLARCPRTHWEGCAGGVGLLLIFEDVSLLALQTHFLSGGKQ